MNKLFTEKGGKFEFSSQGHNLVPFVGNVTKVKIPSEIKPPLVYVVISGKTMNLTTLVYRIDVQYEINVQVGKF